MIFYWSFKFKVIMIGIDVSYNWEIELFFMKESLRFRVSCGNDNDLFEEYWEFYSGFIF